MAIPIYIVKRRLKRKRRNGERHYRYSLQWRESDPTTGKMKLKCETTGTADMTEARELQKLKWAEVNCLIEPRESAEPAAITVSWTECRAALKRAMEADNLRPSYVADSLLMRLAAKSASRHERPR
jgi:hypothetical protein